ncbi:hypothetical protein HK101_001165, partial [Irineochytrium annulatum]
MLASMLAGGTLGVSLTFMEFIGIVLAGNLVLGIYTGALAHIAAKTGLSTHLLAKYAFGAKGSYLPSFLLGFTQVGWFGVGVAMFAIPVAKAMDWNVYLLIIIFGLAMTASAIFGMKSLVILGYIAVPAIAILGGYSMFEGAVGAMAYNLADISEVMFLQGLIIPAIIVLGLNIWTTNDNALYASGLGFANITKISKKFFVVVNGIVGTVFAMWMYNNFVSFLNVLGAAIPSIGAIIIADYFIVKREPEWNLSGTLFEGIQRWSERKVSLTLEDVKTRSKTALKWQLAQGIQHVRTHVDVTDPSLIAVKAMLEVKEEMAPYMDIQLVAFPQEGIHSYPNGAELLEESLKMGVDVVGGIPHFEFTREYGVDSMKVAFDLAEKYDRLIDIHCDEIDDEQSRFVEVVAKEAYERGLGSRTTASHTTAMGSYNDAYTYKLFRLLKMADLNFVSNPLVNIHLQGRFDTYPKRR